MPVNMELETSGCRILSGMRGSRALVFQAKEVECSSDVERR
jgi:hypothetical protein